MNILAPVKPICRATYLGRYPYQEAWDLQRDLGGKRAQGEVPDTLLLLEHPHSYTLGRMADQSNLLLSSEELSELGAEVFEIDRGGDVTYHGPGQLVGYPILLVEDRRDLLKYIRNLEEVLIRTVAGCGISAGRIDGLSGVWVGEEKIAAIGVKMGRVTSHGFALNVTTDLSYFGHIIPCGIRDKGVTSMQRESGLDACVLELPAVAQAVVRHFGDVFGRDMIQDAA